MGDDSGKMRETLHKARLFVGCCPLSFVEVAMGVVVRDKLCDEIDAALSAPPPPDKRGEVCEILDELFAASADGDDREFNAVLARLRDWYEKEVRNETDS